MSDLQTTFDFQLGLSNREFLRVDEVATRLGVKSDYVYELIAEGSLEVHRRQGRQRSAMLVTRRSVIAWLCSTAEYSPADFVMTLTDLARKLSPIERQDLIRRVSRLS